PAGNTLERGSAAGTGTLVGLGTSYLHFDAITVDAAANWLITGSSSLPSGTTLTDAGTLAVSGSLGNHGVIEVASGATLQLLTGEIGAGTVRLLGTGDLLQIGSAGAPATID